MIRIVGRVVLVLFFVLFTTETFARLIKTKIFKNRKCHQSNTCDLKKVSFKVTEFKFNFKSDPSVGNTMYARYETQDNDSLSKYVFVQFIRGCKFTTEKKQGKISYNRNTVREYFGETVIFAHPEWVIDSIDHDPVYWSTTEDEKRHSYYRWNELKGLNNKKTEKMYGPDLNYLVPTHAELYVRDIPGTSLFSYGRAVNTSLEFKICLYKNEDVPRVLTPTELDFATPITCFAWKSSHIYNFTKKRFQTKKSIHPYCHSYNAQEN